MNRGIFPAQERYAGGLSPASALEVVAMAHRRMPGRWYTQAGRSGAAAGPSVNIMKLVPLGICIEPYVIEQFGPELTGAGAAASTMALSLYLGDEYGLPRDLLGFYGTVAMDGTVGYRMTLAMAEIPAGVAVFAGAAPSASTGAFRSYEATAGVSGLIQPLGGLTAPNGPIDNYLYTVAGQVPPARLDPLGVIGGIGGTHRISYKVAP